MKDPIESLLSGDRESIRQAMAETYGDESQENSASLTKSKKTDSAGSSGTNSVAAQIKYFTLLILVFASPIAFWKLTESIAEARHSGELRTIEEELPGFFDIVEDDADFVGTAFSILNSLREIKPSSKNNISRKAFLIAKVSAILALHNAKKGSFEDSDRWLEYSTDSLRTIHDQERRARAKVFIQYTRAKRLYESAHERRVDNYLETFTEAASIALNEDSFNFARDDFYFVAQARMRMLAAIANYRSGNRPEAIMQFEASKKSLDSVIDKRKIGFQLAYGRWAADYGLLNAYFRCDNFDFAEANYTEAIMLLDDSHSSKTSFLCGLLRSNRADLYMTKISGLLHESEFQLTPTIRELLEKEIGDRVLVKKLMNSKIADSINGRTNMIVNQIRLSQAYFVLGEVESAIDTIEGLADIVPDFLSQETPQVTHISRFFLEMMSSRRNEIEKEDAELSSWRAFRFLEKLGPEHFSDAQITYLIFLSKVDPKWQTKIRDRVPERWRPLFN